MDRTDAVLEGTDLTEAVSLAMVELYARVHAHDRTTATTYINDNVVVVVLEDILTASESNQVDEGHSDGVIDRRIAFQIGAQNDFTEAIERLTRRRVVAFMSANKTSPGIASELFFLESPADVARRS